MVPDEQQEEGGEEEGGDQEAVPEGGDQGVRREAKQGPMDKSSYGGRNT